MYLPRLVHGWISRRLQPAPGEARHLGPPIDEKLAADPGGGLGRSRLPPGTGGAQTPRPPAQLEVRLLGPFRMSSEKATLARWPSRKGKFLLAYLALNHERRVGRDVLMDMFWPRSSPPSARNCLNVTIHGLRQLLRTVEDRREIIIYGSEHYFLNPDVPMWLDVEEFSKGWKEGQRCEREERVAEALSAYSRAANLYAGDLMEEDPYEDWLALERERLKELYLVILGKISRYYSLDGDPERAIGLCEHMLERDRCQEEVYRRMMLCYYRLGFRDKALKQYSRCVEALRARLDAAPTTETVLLYDSIRRQAVDEELYGGRTGSDRHSAARDFFGGAPLPDRKRGER